MAQDYIKLNGTVIAQPDEGLGYDFETTYTEDSTRVQSGKLHASAMFTVESLSYKATYITAAEASVILRIVDSGRPFTLHYYSLHYGAWRDGRFYVGKGTLSVGRLNERDETVDELSFNMIGVDPI